MSPASIGRGVSVTFYGHSAFKLSGGGLTVVIDPWLSNPLLNTPVEKVGKVDLILVTHGHGDRAQQCYRHEPEQQLCHRHRHSRDAPG